MAFARSRVDLGERGSEMSLSAQRIELLAEIKRGAYVEPDVLTDAEVTKMVEELQMAGWIQESPRIWMAPDGSRRHGPVKAWLRMKKVK